MTRLIEAQEMLTEVCQHTRIELRIRFQILMHCTAVFIVHVTALMLLLLATLPATLKQPLRASSEPWIYELQALLAGEDRIKHK
jgi:hypothetical protein